MENDTKKMPEGFKIRLLVSALLFLLVFALSQIKETKTWLRSSGIATHIESFEDIYRLEDECILWYNSLAKEK